MPNPLVFMLSVALPNMVNLLYHEDCARCNPHTNVLPVFVKPPAHGDRPYPSQRRPLPIDTSDKSHSHPRHVLQQTKISHRYPHPDMFIKPTTASGQEEAGGIDIGAQSGAIVTPTTPRSYIRGSSEQRGRGATREITKEARVMKSVMSHARMSQKATTMMAAAVKEAMEMLVMKLKEESYTAKKVGLGTGSQRPFKLVQKFLHSKPLAKQLSFSSFVIRNASNIVLRQLGMEGKSGMHIFESAASPLPQNSHQIGPDEVAPQPDPGTCPWPSYSCVTGKYRTFDGSCNNLHNPILGRSFTPFKRYLPPEYGDRVQSMRVGKGGRHLPGARLVSMVIHGRGTHAPHHIHTNMVMQWGQFVDHDFSLTAISKLSADPSGFGATLDFECGHNGCDTGQDNCVPILIPGNDPNFHGRPCLEFVRSQDVPNLQCTIGAREQLNQLTSFIDASMVYGSSKVEAETLRDLYQKDRGQLLYTDHPTKKSWKHLLPQQEQLEPNLCKETSDSHRCFRAGDERVNEQSDLVVLHTIWLREHNRVEARLHTINPQWDGQTLYQETRRIMGAMVQHITYNEWLPVILGMKGIHEYNLRLLKTGYFKGYNSSINPSIANVFATAAFRFGHSLVPSTLHRFDETYRNNTYAPIPLSSTFFRPGNIYNDDQGGIDAFLRGLIHQRVETTDKYMTKQITTHLFNDNPPRGLGTDLISLNIQRGRDHGIPGYNAWRKWCGLKVATSFSGLVDIPDVNIRKAFKKLYKHVDDIDLFPAGVTEKHIDGGFTGPTFACIIGTQFSDLRTGDRFWYENNGPNSFTRAQLDEIRKTTLAKVICQNSDGIVNIQPWVMEMPFRHAYPTLRVDPRSKLSAEWFQRLWLSDYNRRVNCSCLPDINLIHWKEPNTK